MDLNKSKLSGEKKRKLPNENEDNKEEENFDRYLPLYGAALEGDWESAKKIFDGDRSAMTAKITDNHETALHIAVTGGKAMKFVKELVTMHSDSLEQVDKKNRTALFHAAAVGNTEVARFLVGKKPNLTQKTSYLAGYTPLHIAAKNGHKDTVVYLLSVTRDVPPSPFKHQRGIYLLRNLITSNLSGIAVNLLLKDHPDLAKEERLQSYILEMVQQPSMFESGTQLGYWKRLIYRSIPVEKHNLPDSSKRGDIEKSIDCFETLKNFGFLQQISNSGNKSKILDSTLTQTIVTPTLIIVTWGYLQYGYAFRRAVLLPIRYPADCTMHRKVCVVFWNAIKQLVPCINHIYGTKVTHAQTLELVKLMFKEMNLSQETAPKFLKGPLFRAIELGIHELVKEIIRTYPPSALFLDDEKRNIFQLAVLHRQEKVFSLIYHMGLYRHFMEDFKDIQGNNILHLAGKLQPSNQVSGPALQMQQELQWFKAVETLVQPSFQEQKTQSKHGKGLTPRQLFTKEHSMLVKEGKEWMKDVAQSCSVVATLIVTMVFAAVFTVPGGNNSEGKPILLHTPSFIIFVISDALALFFSTTSVLMFLGILTSRYSEEDFLKSLPGKLISALITLVISIASMTVAFGAALYIVLVDISKLVIIPIALLVCLPVILYAWLQFPLLVDVFRSTYRPGILRTVN